MVEDTATGSGRILIADDRPALLGATADFLRGEGYQCDCAADAAGAAWLLQENRYDLLISEIKTPASPELELINQVKELARGTPVVLVSGYPSVESAAEAVGLPVVAYLFKPLDFAELLERVRFWVQRSRTYRAVCASQQLLADWCKELEQVEASLRDPVDKESAGPIAAFVELTLNNVAEALADLGRLTRTLGQLRGRQGESEAIAWTQVAAAHQTLEETIDVLELTKGPFKSKQLGRLRHRLQVVVHQWDDGKPWRIGVT